MTLAALTVPLPAGASAPVWIELIPAGGVVAGYDGRAWSNPDPAAVVAATAVTANRPLPVDWEHATITRAGQGQEAPAAGWIKALEVRAGAIWGRVEWTPRAADQVRAHEYKFVSPAFQHELTPPHKIVRLQSVGLTNTPNLPLTALNSFRGGEKDRAPTATEIEVARRFNMDPRRLAQN